MYYKLKISCLLIFFVVISFSCNRVEGRYVNNFVTEETKNYVLNISSMKVHTSRCVSAGKISKKNRKEVFDKLSNIIKEGYTICHNCNAGMKKSNLFQTLVDNLYHRNLLLNEPNELATYEEFITAIDKMGEWYVNNIPTYLTELEEENLSDYSGDSKSIQKYKLKNKFKSGKETIKEYNVIANEGQTRISEYDSKTKILKANESAVKNYRKNYGAIDFIKNLAYYPCEHISTSLDDYKKVGDDCVRYVFSVLNCMDNRFTKLFKDYSMKNWKNVNSKVLSIKEPNVLYAMSVLGFEIYDTNIYNIDINGDNLIDVEVNQIASNFKLMKGDIIAKNGHVHFYLGNTDQSVIDFGWGKVNRVYPQISNNPEIITKNNKHVIRFRDNDYTRVYRYVGNK